MTGRRLHSVISGLVLLCALALPRTVSAAGGVILNTLQGFNDHEPGWSGSIDGLFSGSGGNTERIILAANGTVQWRGERNRWQLRANWGYEESNGVNTAKNATTHLRHNYDIRKSLATIAFIQAQENAFQRIESRWLVGAGLRADIVDDDESTVLFGVTPMYEVERVEGQDRVRRGRLSTFLFASHTFDEKFGVSGTGFYQPLFEDVGNYRTVGTLTFSMELTGALELKAGASVDTNSRPAPGVERTDWNTFTALTVKL
ncbi:MAG TPA: DUF481 domain-containing protein [Candidatus Krumholzibacteria bacterium]|nr:DUF481 domain-containing protein [Candidatus Krumholzibacteria bacterium]